MNRFFFPLFVVFVLHQCDAQLLESHLWKDRILLVFSPDYMHPSYLEQMDIFVSSHEQDLKERKLVIYRILPDKTESWPRGYTKGKKSASFYQEYHVDNKAFRVLLIGLDGGVKLRQEEVLTTEKLFGLIDGMPMRIRELKGY